MNDRRQSDAIIAVVLLVFALLVVGGGAMGFLAYSRAQAAQERAIMQEMRARQVAEELQATEQMLRAENEALKKKVKDLDSDDSKLSETGEQNDNPKPD